MASVVAKPAPTAAPISSSKYGKCHLSGASTTPSREMKKFDLILRIEGLLSGSATDAVADVRCLRRVDHPHDLQLDQRRQHVEQPAPLAEQHRDLMDLHLIQHPCLERPLRRVRATHLHVPV